MPTTITVPYDAPVGAVLHTTSQVAPSQNLTITCSGTTNYGVSNVVGATPGVGTAIYPTGIAGVGYRLLHGTSDPSDYMYPYPCCRLAAGSYNFTVTTAVQLIKTGTIADGARLPSGTFARWLYDRSSGGGTVSTQNYLFGNAVTFISPACQVTTTNIAVALPPVNTTSLPAPDATAGATSFRIGMNCRSGATLNIMFETNSPVSGKPGVISQPTGGATRARRRRATGQCRLPAGELRNRDRRRRDPAGHARPDLLRALLPHRCHDRQQLLGRHRQRDGDVHPQLRLKVQS